MCLQLGCWLLRQLIKTSIFISSRGGFIFDERKLEVACGLVPAVWNCLPSQENLCSFSHLMCAEGSYIRPSIGEQFAQCMHAPGKEKKKKKMEKMRRQTISIADTIEVRFKILFMLPIFNAYMIDVRVHQTFAGSRVNRSRIAVDICPKAMNNLLWLRPISCCIARPGFPLTRSVPTTAPTPPISSDAEH